MARHDVCGEIGAPLDCRITPLHFHVRSVVLLSCTLQISKDAGNEQGLQVQQLQMHPFKWENLQQSIGLWYLLPWTDVIPYSPYTCFTTYHPHPPGFSQVSLFKTCKANVEDKLLN